MNAEQWVRVGSAADLVSELEQLGGLKELEFDGKKLVLTYHEGEFGALNNKCNHMGGPLSKGKLKKGCVECPWHYWQFNHKTGESCHGSAEPLSSAPGAVPRYPLKTENGSLFIDLANPSERVRAAYNKMTDLWREPKREPGRIRVLGISTTAMDPSHPRYSTSEDLLRSALERAGKEIDVDTKVIALSELNFRHCEGFYSKAEKACTWPCSITKMDPKDEMLTVYEHLVHWADVVILSTPIRWGNASSLYYKMAERLNSVQNQITINNKVLIQNKTVGLIITGGQDNIQSVAGQMLNFFGELGFTAPPFPYMGHSLGWSAEDMEKNTDYVAQSEYLHDSSFQLVVRSVDLVKKLIPATASI